jgi:hypothetical protein
MQPGHRSRMWIGKEGKNRESRTRVAQPGHPRNDFRQRTWTNCVSCRTTPSTISRTCFAYQVQSTIRTNANSFRIASTSAAQSTGLNKLSCQTNRVWRGHRTAASRRSVPRKGPSALEGKITATAQDLILGFLLSTIPRLWTMAQKCHVALQRGLLRTGRMLLRARSLAFWGGSG